MWIMRYRKLIELELLERLAGEVITSLIHIRIENHVQESCKGSFDTSYISSLESVSMIWSIENVGHIQQDICIMFFIHFWHKACKMMTCTSLSITIFCLFLELLDRFSQNLVLNVYTEFSCGLHFSLNPV